MKSTNGAIKTLQAEGYQLASWKIERPEREIPRDEWTPEQAADKWRCFEPSDKIIFTVQLEKVTGEL